MVEFVQQGKEKFPNLEVAYIQKFVVDYEILFSQLVSITSSIAFHSMGSKRVISSSLEESTCMGSSLSE